jgi:20S proteasome alpha/beta subunit
MALGKMIDTAVGNGPERPRRDDSHGRIITDDDGTKIKNGSILTSPRPSNVLYQQEYNNQEPDGNGLPILNLRPVSIDGICNFFQSELFKYQGQLGVNLIVGNVWHGKAHLRAVHPHGSIDKDLPFAALGSGGLAAMAVLEEGYYKPRSSRGNDDEQRSTDAPCTSLEEGIKLVQRAVLSGIRNDLGSGSALDLCIIYPDGTSHHTRCSIPEEMLEEIDVRKSNDEDDDDDLRDNLQSFDEQQIEGVNGFGNQPFVVDSMKQRVLSIELDEKQRMSDWKELLGM